MSSIQDRPVRPILAGQWAAGAPPGRSPTPGGPEMSAANDTRFRTPQVHALPHADTVGNGTPTNEQRLSDAAFRLARCRFLGGIDRPTLAVEGNSPA